MCKKLMIMLLAMLSPVWAGTNPALPAALSAGTNHVLIIERSSAAVSGGKATLSIGPLQRRGGVYAGDYQMKVSPYFFKGEKGRLAIVVSDESLTKVSQGRPAEITGTATTKGKGGATRRIDATATPSNSNGGALKLWFISGDRKMVFDTSYRFVEK